MGTKTKPRPSTYHYRFSYHPKNYLHTNWGACCCFWTPHVARGTHTGPAAMIKNPSSCNSASKHNKHGYISIFDVNWQQLPGNKHRSAFTISCVAIVLCEQLCEQLCSSLGSDNMPPWASTKIIHAPRRLNHIIHSLHTEFAHGKLINKPMNMVSTNTKTAQIIWRINNYSKTSQIYAASLKL